ncbi:MAG: hypothetical protein JEZ01_03145 [Labilibaculum sp.]|nr:hypothetical protein [Labilibaculum sp.]MBI9056748.1 hypothetical protein [Labilibaculum sp.]
MTGNVKYIRHIYKVERAKKVYTVYQLKPTTQTPVLTNLVRIEQFRKYSNGKGFDEYLRLRNTSNWKTSEQVTGLKKTDNSNVFFGDRIHLGKKNLIVFKFSNDKEYLLIDYYKGYYPTNGNFKAILDKYQ